VLPERDLHDLLLEGSDVDETMQRVMVVGETTDGERERETLVSQWGVNVTTCPDLESACARLGVDVNDVRAIVDELRDELARRPSR
jgi:sugar diacid utilization regulator